MRHLSRGRLAVFLLSACAMGAQAQSVAMTGGMGSKALLVVDGSPPKAVGVGDTFKGVKVISVNSDQAVVEMKGQRQTVRLGGAPISVGGGGGGGTGTQIVLSAVSGGHFMSQGSVNGRATRFLVDTGASVVSMGVDEAQRMGINYKDGQQVRMSTANGVVTAYQVTLNSVRIQDVEVYNVDATVSPQAMPFMLLGNSFLSRFQMKRDNDTLTLTRRY
ncbi:MAG: retroviral-like aspartic protease family protein [Burkholderiales bacterium]|nr:retroviral-like aspartic protease family protein [Burkholderiales bacterium]